MLNTNITNLRKNLFSYLQNTILYDEPINISTKEGNAVLLSEEDYNGLIATIQLLSISGMEEKLVKGKNTPIEECIPEEEVDW